MILVERHQYLCSSSRGKISGLTATQVFVLATPKSPIDRGMCTLPSNCLLYGCFANLMRSALCPTSLPTSVFSRGFAEKNWGFGFALERILAWWQAAAVSGVHEVHARRPCCPS
jgi:hypothetical protein